MANLLDFLRDYKHIVRINHRITICYVIYIGINLAASLLGPSTVALMLAETFHTSFG